MLTATLSELMGEVDNLLLKEPNKRSLLGDDGYGMTEDDQCVKGGYYAYSRKQLADMVIHCQELLLQIQDAYLRECQSAPLSEAAAAPPTQSPASAPGPSP